MKHFEQLEPRLALAIAVTPAGDIEVIGTPGDDSIQFLRVNASTVRVVLNSTVQNVKAPGRLIAYGGDGNDTITNTNLARPVSFYGEAGNDTLTGGSGDDRIYGGDGNDIIFGRAGNDLVAGNAGNDQVYGDNGRDVVLGGDGVDLIRSGQGMDCGNAEVTTIGAYPTGALIGTEYSTVYGDANDLAMLALLNDQADDGELKTLGFILNFDDGEVDDTSDFQ